VHEDLWRRVPRDAPALVGGVRAALAAGAGVGRLAGTAIADTATAATAHVVGRSRQLLPGSSAHALLTELAGRVDRVRARLEREGADALRALLRRVVEASLTALDVTELVRAHVDLDALAAGLDVDAVIARADIEAVVARTDLDGIVRRVDVDAIVRRIDVEAIVRTMDLDELVARVDVDRVAARIDLDAIVGRIDVDRIAAGLDLDAIVERIDPDAVVARVDVEAVLERLDLAGIARQVLRAIDLPAILRESTGAVSSQAARVVRTEGRHADDSVARFIDRVLRRPQATGALPV